MTIFMNRAGVNVFERRLLGVTSALLLAGFLHLVIRSNGPGVVVMASALSVVGIVILEFFRPWSGFYLFLLFWPSNWVIRELLTKWASPDWVYLPDLWGSPAAMALTLGVWLRWERSHHNWNVSPDGAISNRIWKWLPAFRISIWGVVLTFVISCIAALWRTYHPPEGWIVINRLTPLFTTLTFLPSLFLGLLLLNFIAMNYLEAASSPSQERRDNSGFLIPYRIMVSFALAGGAVALLIFLLQMATGFAWSFNSGGDPHAGPFLNKNTTAPFFIITSVLFFSVRSEDRWKRWALYAIGCTFVIAAIMTLSRNAVFMTASILGSLLLVRANRRRVFFLIFAVVLITIPLLFDLPLPDLKAVSSSPLLSRTVVTLRKLQNNGLELAVGTRWPLYKTAYLIFKDYPLFGSGPGTFAMLTAEGGRYGVSVASQHFSSAHSMPLNLLAEMGIAGMASWVMVWLLLPFVAVVRWRMGNILALGVLITGLGNLFDTVWMVPGMTTLCVLIVVWACTEYQNSCNTDRIHFKNINLSTSGEA
jgi:O-antigen ligase